MIVGILKEAGYENRVALLPAEAGTLKSMGIDLIVERNAGERAFAPDSAYEKVGARVADRKKLIAESEFLLSVNPPVEDDIKSFREGQVLCSVLNPVDKQQLA